MTLLNRCTTAAMSRGNMRRALRRLTEELFVIVDSAPSSEWNDAQKKLIRNDDIVTLVRRIDGLWK
jgi:hypothetical protein